MGSVTIRRLDDRTHAALRVRAAAHGRSVEAEIRAILDDAVGRPDGNVLTALHDAVHAAAVTVELEIGARTDMPRPVEP